MSVVSEAVGLLIVKQKDFAFLSMPRMLVARGGGKKNIRVEGKKSV